jgi:hypothetical protein
MLVAIVNYKSAGLVEDCLNSLAKERAGGAEFSCVVADNASGDGSVETLRAAIAREGWGDWAEVLALPMNGGFAYGNNRVVERALGMPRPPDSIFLLNPDTWVRPGAIRALIDFLAAHPEAHLLGSRLEDPDGTAQHSVFRFHSILGEVEGNLRVGVLSRLLARWRVAPPIPDAPCETHWLSGAALLVRREVFEKIGQMDEQYFMYFEETDFCLRARQAGFRCWYVPQSRVVHLVGATSGVTVRHERPKRRPQYWFESRQRYFVKNHGRAYALAADVAFILSQALWELRVRIERRPNPDPPRLLRDFVRFTWR